MAIPWKCGECKRQKHKDCEAMNEPTGEFCECVRCKLVFRQNLFSALEKPEPDKN